MCRLGSENTRPTGNRQEHAPNAVCPQANNAGKGLRSGVTFSTRPLTSSAYRHLVCVVLGVGPKFEPNKFGGVGKKRSALAVSLRLGLFFLPHHFYRTQSRQQPGPETRRNMYIIEDCLIMDNITCDRHNQCGPDYALSSQTQSNHPPGRAALPLCHARPKIRPLQR